MALLAATSMVTLAGCSVFAMSEEDAGKHYMAIVCPSNATVDGYNAALETGDLGQIQTAAKTMAEAYRESAKALTSTDTHWPDAVAEADLQTLANSYLTDLAVINAITSAITVDEARVMTDQRPSGGGSVPASTPRSRPALRHEPGLRVAGGTEAVPRRRHDPRRGRTVRRPVPVRLGHPRPRLRRHPRVGAVLPPSMISTS